ncbi:MAG: carbon-phosphorus lyase [Peptococcaceae bacterium BRH_c4a]|nr:MAG: carbon-phosphorus lyase [Peptococcaceae bacterium BRH_c4a]
MGYVAVKGGAGAIAAAEELVKYFRVKGGSDPVAVRQIQDQFRLAVDKVMGEAGLYAPFYAALAIKQAEGDLVEASFILRAFCSSQPRQYYSVVANTGEMEVIRRISASFKDIPGGQILGPTRDYTQRLLDFELAGESRGHVEQFLSSYLKDINLSGRAAPATFPKVVDLLRAEGLLDEESTQPEEEIFDITRDAVTFPAPRTARLQAMARAETGGLMAIAYSSMRGYGNVHPNLGELRVGYLPLKIRHPEMEGEVYVGRVLVTETEVITRFAAGEDGMPRFTMGYGLCFGHNEIKAISMAVLDRAMRSPAPGSPAGDQEFVLYHTDGIEASGFSAHWKLPHYVTFQADLEQLRAAQDRQRKGEA